MTPLVVKDVFTGYRGKPIVRSLSLTVDEGELAVLVGPNGAGKTTSLLTIAAIIPRISGEITILGEPLPPPRSADRVIRRGLGFVPENRDLFPGLTVMQHLLLALPRGTAQSELGWLFELMPQLSKVADRKAGLLSGGEQQMLATARALARRPRVLLIDELSLGLAPLIAADLADMLRVQTDKHGTAVLLVEQHIDLALSVADSVYVLSHGALVLKDSAEAVRADLGRIETSYLGLDIEQ